MYVLTAGVARTGKHRFSVGQRGLLNLANKRRRSFVTRYYRRGARTWSGTGCAAGAARRPPSRKCRSGTAAIEPDFEVGVGRDETTDCCPSAALCAASCRRRSPRRRGCRSRETRRRRGSRSRSSTARASSSTAAPTRARRSRRSSRATSSAAACSRRTGAGHTSVRRDAVELEHAQLERPPLGHREHLVLHGLQHGCARVVAAALHTQARANAFHHAPARRR